MSKKEYILAIDHGTTSTRAILFDHDCRICGISQKEGSVDYPSPGWVEQDAVQIWLDTMAVMADVLNQSGIDPDQVKGIEFPISERQLFSGIRKQAFQFIKRLFGSPGRHRISVMNGNLQDTSRPFEKKQV